MNLYDQLDDLKDAFSEKYEEARDFAAGLLDAQRLTKPYYSFTLNDGSYITYTTSLDDMNVYDANDTMIGYCKFLSEYRNDPDFLSKSISGAAAYCWGDIIEMLKQSVTTNEGLANIAINLAARGYILNNEIIDNLTLGSRRLTEDTLMISNALHSMCHDGKLHAASFVGYVRELTNRSKSATDSGTWVLDETNPFSIKSFISTVSATLVQSALSLLGIVVVGISKIAGAILYFGSTLISAASTVVDNKITLDTSGSNDYIDGPVIISDQIPLKPSSIGDDSLCLEKTLTKHNTLCGDLYVWPNANSTAYGSANCFLRPIFSLTAIEAVLHDCVEEIDDETGYAYVKVRQPSPQEIAGCVMSYAQWIQCFSNIDDCQRILFLDQCVRDFLLIDIGTKIDDNRGSWWPYVSYNESDYIEKRGAMSYRVTNAFNLAIKCLETYPTSIPLEWLPSDVGYVKGILQNVFIPEARTALDRGKLQVFESGGYRDIKFSFNDLPTEEPPYHIYGAMLTSLFRLSFRYNFDVDTGFYWIEPDPNGYIIRSREVYSIPTSRAITIPQFTWADVTKTLVILGAAVTAFFIVKGVIGKHLAANRALKQNDRVRKLNQLRDQYNANPTKENAAAWKKEILRYNKWSNFFGWGTYDAANGWLNPPDTGVIGAALEATDTSSIFDKASSTYDKAMQIGTQTGLIPAVQEQTSDIKDDTTDISSETSGLYDRVVTIETNVSRLETITANQSLIIDKLLQLIQ